MAKIEIYTTATCPFCIAAKELLSSKKVSFTEIDAERSDVREAMAARAAGAQTVPQIFINDTHIGGCDELYTLEQASKLDSLLQG